MTILERLDRRVAEARTLLERATLKRDKAIADLTRAMGNIKKAQQALGRTEKRRIAAKVEERKARKAKPVFNDIIPL